MTIDPAARAGHVDHPPRMGFFTDTSVCIGCKACEVACKEWNAVPEDGISLSGMSYDNTVGLGASTWRHVAFVEQPAAEGIRWLMSSDVCKHCAHLSGHRELARVAKLSALGAISLSAAALVHDLGRPARFTNMLRVFKPSSPMSVGSWLLAGYGPVAGAAAVSEVTGILPAGGTAATLGAGLFGPAIATYTAALICDTAVPAWHAGYREMPYVFVGSAASAAGGLGLLATPPGAADPARRLAVLGAGVELVAKRRLIKRLATPGLVSLAEPYETGRTGVVLRVAEALTAGGLTGALLGRRSRALSALSGAALLAASALTRFGIFEAGMASARDPKYTIVPQRQRQP